MADALNADRITIDQTLHGYSEGHRLIEGSVKLPQPDARTMLVLSDASGSGSRIPPNGYLTGYPLAEAARAHRDLESRKTTGSIVLMP